MRAVTVVKLGGSHALSDELRTWLGAIEAGAGKTILVPGGGPFADAVRLAQPRMGFDDRAADCMALLAMEQYAIAIAAIGRLFTVADSLTGMRLALRSGRLPVWAPRRMLRQAKDRAVSWDVTSDSLAAWLAGSIRATRLLLVKKVEAGNEPLTARGLASDGIVDPAFPGFIGRAGVPSFLLGPGEQADLAEALRGGDAIGRPVGLVLAAGAAHHVG